MAAQRIVDQIVKLLKDTQLGEQDQLLLLERVKSEICTPAMLAKVQNPGAAELLACKIIGLKWNESVHGRDAENSAKQAVEIKTTSKSKEKGNVNFNFSLPPIRANESNKDHARRIYEAYMNDKKYKGGHYLVYLNRRKTKVLSYYWISRDRMAKYASDYGLDHPLAKSFNLGRVVCKKCENCCWLLTYGIGFSVIESERDPAIWRTVQLAGPCSKVSKVYFFPSSEQRKNAGRSSSHRGRGTSLVGVNRGQTIVRGVRNTVDFVIERRELELFGDLRRISVLEQGVVHRGETCDYGSRKAGSTVDGVSTVTGDIRARNIHSYRPDIHTVTVVAEISNSVGFIDSTDRECIRSTCGGIEASSSSRPSVAGSCDNKISLCVELSDNCIENAITGPLQTEVDHAGQSSILVDPTEGIDDVRSVGGTTQNRHSDFEVVHNRVRCNTDSGSCCYRGNSCTVIVTGSSGLSRYYKVLLVATHKLIMGTEYARVDNVDVRASSCPN